MTEAEALLQRYLTAQQDHDLDALVSCWHPEVQVYTRCDPTATGAASTPTGASGP